jgi:hypothetical protein
MPVQQFAEPFSEQVFKRIGAQVEPHYIDRALRHVRHYQTHHGFGRSLEQRYGIGALYNESDVRSVIQEMYDWLIVHARPAIASSSNIALSVSGKTLSENY